VNAARDHLDVSYVAANGLIRELCELDVLSETTGNYRNRVRHVADNVARAVATRARIAADRRSAFQARHTFVGGISMTGIAAASGGFFDAKNVSVPAAVSVFPGEIYQAPLSWAERAYPNLIYYNKVDAGGHFAAWEQPQLLTEEVRAGFRPLR